MKLNEAKSGGYAKAYKEIQGIMNDWDKVKSLIGTAVRQDNDITKADKIEDQARLVQKELVILRNMLRILS